LKFSGPELLSTDHVVAGFDCGDPALNEWLVNRAPSNQGVRGSSRTWVVLDESSRVVAYYAASTATVLHREATGRMRRNQPDPLPALLLGRLAVDGKHQTAGLGSALLKHFIMKGFEVAGLVGVRLLLVHAANPDAASFYARYGFVSSPVDDLTMMLLVKDVSTA